MNQNVIENINFLSFLREILIGVILFKYNMDYVGGVNKRIIIFNLFWIQKFYFVVGKNINVCCCFMWIVIIYVFFIGYDGFIQKSQFFVVWMVQFNLIFGGIGDYIGSIYDFVYLGRLYVNI